MSQCGGTLTVWGLLHVTNGPKDQSGVTDPLEWVHLKHVDQWESAVDRQEATKKRTSSTGGAARKFCPDITSFDMEITNTICPNEQWLYGAILAYPGNASVGVTAWWFFAWGPEYAPDANTGVVQSEPLAIIVASATTGNELGRDGTVGTAFVHSEAGFYGFGTVNPPGFGGENDGSDPVTADWTISLTKGPIKPIPALAGSPQVGWILS